MFNMLECWNVGVVTIVLAEFANMRHQDNRLPQKQKYSVLDDI